jgi:flagellar assembly factor FliW
VSYKKKTVLGEIEYNDNNIIELPKSIPGFDGVEKAIWFSSPEFDPVKWLIIDDEKGSALPLLDPFMVLDDYTADIPDQIVELLEIESQDEVAVMCIANPRKGEAPTVNLRAPIVINAKERKAAQIILDDESLSVRFEWEPEEEKAEIC